jgi:hypothetical protein
MKESPFGFEYNWDDLRPIRALAIVSLVFQLFGAAIGLWTARYPSWFANLWAGGALATFPGFAIGLFIQQAMRPGSLVENKVMVRRMGLIALALSASVFIMPLDEFHAG